VARADRLGLAVVASGADIAADRAQTLAVAAGSERFLVPLTEEGIWLCRPILGDPRRPKAIHDLKQASEMLANVGLDLAGPVLDLEICDYLIDANNYNHTLPAIATRFLGGDHRLTQPAAQAAAVLALHAPVAAKIDELGLDRVLNEVELPLVAVLAAMEREGIFVDADLLVNYSNELDVMARRVEKELYAAAGREFNVNSPTQLRELLFEELKLQDAAGLKRVKRTKTGLSTDESVLTRLAASHPVPKLILDYRLITKLKNTYVDPLPQCINPRTGRVHTRFRQTVAATGRLSCDRPNLQNIPMRSELGRKIRAAFRPESPDWVMVSADYSQVEIRLLAHLAGADDLIAAFRAGLDIHTVTAAKVFRVAETAVSPLMRSRAKAVNFGIIYGMGPQRLAEETGATLTEAKDFIRRYFEIYPGIRAYTESLIQRARETGYCVTMLGRRRPIPEIRDQSRVMLARGENIAVNAPIQGSAADLIKLAMIRAHAAIKARRLKSRMVLQVHDELVFVAPRTEVAELAALVREAMEHALETSVPLKVEVSSGATWLDAH
jgi:DNA polymerase-1